MKLTICSHHVAVVMSASAKLAQNKQTSYLSQDIFGVIQGDSRRKVNILGGDIFRHCDRHVYVNTCIILMVTEMELFESTNTTVL
jgi:hypothetical protein